MFLAQLSPKCPSQMSRAPAAPLMSLQLLKLNKFYMESDIFPAPLLTSFRLDKDVPPHLCHPLPHCPLISVLPNVTVNVSWHCLSSPSPRPLPDLGPVISPWSLASALSPSIQPCCQESPVIETPDEADAISTLTSQVKQLRPSFVKRPGWGFT